VIVRQYLSDVLPIDAWQRQRRLELAGSVDRVGGPGSLPLSDELPMADWQQARRSQVQDRDVVFGGQSTDSLTGGAGTGTVKIDASTPARVPVGALPPTSERQWETEAARATQPPPPPFRGTPAEWAEAHVGHGGYSKFFDNAPDARGPIDNRLPPGLRGYVDPKCNQFVWDALTAGGAQPKRMPDGRIPIARDWGDRKSQIGGYAVVSGPPRPGDVVSDGDHVGIYAPLPDGRPGTISAASPFTDAGAPFGRVVHNDWGFRPKEKPVIYWRPAGTPSK
jgi:hypothetical protein